MQALSLTAQAHTLHRLLLTQQPALYLAPLPHPLCLAWLQQAHLQRRTETPGTMDDDVIDTSCNGVGCIERCQRVDSLSLTPFS